MNDIKYKIAESIENILSESNNQNIRIKADQYNMDLTLLGMESLTFIRIIVSLEEIFDIRLPEEKLLMSELNTVNKFAEIISHRNN